MLAHADMAVFGISSLCLLTADLVSIDLHVYGSVRDDLGDGIC
jgi:hypothetical protein